MGNTFIYKCPKCKHETTLSKGIGFLCPNPPEIEDDVQAGLYGKLAKAFVNEHPEHILDASLEIYQCRCGNVQNEYHVVLRADNAKSYFNRQRCNKCGAVMKMLDEPPEKIGCSECGRAMDLDAITEILWD